MATTHRPTVCLVMICRDEERIIERCLRSVRPLLDHWVIVDTGSTDETPRLIGRALEGIPGELHTRPWVNFGHNRSEAMRLAQGKADWRLWLDADMTLEFDAEEVWRELRETPADAFMVTHLDTPTYQLKHVVAGDQNWWHEGVTHEYPTTDREHRTEHLDAIVIHHHADGGTRPEKFQRDLELLTQALDDNPADVRACFYLANTYRDLGMYESAIPMYHRRASMGGWDQEIYESKYQAAKLSDDIGGLFQAWSYRPSRAEPLYELAWRFRKQNAHHAAYLVAERGVRIPIPDDTLFVHRWVYEWGLLFEYSIACYWTGQPGIALVCCDRLLAVPTLPDAYREQVQTNRRFSEALLAQCEAVAT